MIDPFDNTPTQPIDRENKNKKNKCLDKNVGFLDLVINKIISRKLLVFIIATGLIEFGLDPETWAQIAMAYMTGQSAIDIINVWKWGNNTN